MSSPPAGPQPEKGKNMLQKNDLIPLTIVDITNEGAGVGRCDGMAIFVPGTAVGDELTVRVVKVLKKYAYRILSPDSGSRKQRQQ